MIKNREEFDKKVISLMINFHFTPEGGENGLKIYMANLYSVLSEKFGLTDQQFYKAIDSILFNGIKYKKYPAASDFLDALGMSPKVLGGKAWVALKSAIKRVGRYKSVRFGRERRHLALHETIKEFGTWSEMCDRTYSEMEKLENKFIEKYIEIYMTRELKEDTFLIGQYDTHPVELNQSRKQIAQSESNSKTPYQKLYEEQMKKIGFKEEE